MDPKAIRTELWRVRNDLLRLGNLLTTVRESECLAFRRIACTHCRRIEQTDAGPKPAHDFILLLLLRYTFSPTDDDGRVFLDKSLSLIVDGYCMHCAQRADIWNFLCRLDPELDPKLANARCYMQTTGLCAVCGENALTGIWRGKTCTGGICVLCHNVDLPNSLRLERIRNLRFLAREEAYASRREAELIKQLAAVLGPPQARIA